MLEKYGKFVEMRKINRNLNGIRNAIEGIEKSSDKYYRPPKEGMCPTCRICGSKSANLFVKVWGNYEYYQCEECEALFLHNLPDVESMYSGDEDTANGSIYIDDATYAQRVKMISAPKVNFILDACSLSGNKVQKWLDIGCGGGEILSYLKNSKIEGVGIESDIRECEFAINKGLDVYCHFIDLEKEDSKTEKLIKESDVISFMNVLEHIVNPTQFVEYLFEKMKPGGGNGF